jgi:hypothetical protein
MSKVRVMLRNSKLRRGLDGARWITGASIPVDGGSKL